MNFELAQKLRQGRQVPARLRRTTNSPPVDRRRRRPWRLATITFFIDFEKIEQKYQRLSTTLS